MTSRGGRSQGRRGGRPGCRAGSRATSGRWLCRGLAAWGWANVVVAAGAAVQPPLDLDVFEDDDCREAPNADVLLALLHDLADLLDRALFSTGMPAGREGGSAWADFEAWQAEHLRIMAGLVAQVFSRPYCEPGKVAWMAAECLLVLRGGPGGEDEALRCAEALDEDFLTQMTPRGSGFVTRLHLMLRSPWPAFRLLDLLVRLHPESGSTRMGACRRFQNWRQDPDVFDWTWFKPLLSAAVDAATAAPATFELRPEDGPLSRQYRARWLRVHGDLPGMQEAIAFSDDVFEAYREHHYRAGCHLGVISCYILQVLLLHLRDVEGRLHRYVASVAQLINLHAAFPHLVKTDWPIFRLLHLASLLQRTPPVEVWEGAAAEPLALPDAAGKLVAAVGKAVAGLPAGEGFVLVTAAWGFLSRFAGDVLRRWSALLGAGGGGAGLVTLLFLALDAEALAECRGARGVHCIDAPKRLGVEGVIAKYLALAEVSRAGCTAMWLDLDIYLAATPVPHIRAAMEAPGRPDLLFARHAASESVSPAVVVARGSPEATELMLRYASWLRENPYLLDHQGWDQFLERKEGDFAAGFDYQGRNVTVKDDKGPAHSFMPFGGTSQPDARYALLGDAFGSGDGWYGDEGAAGLVLFHFWGANEPQEQLFQLLYPHTIVGFPARSLSMLSQYRREILSGPTVPALLGSNASEGGAGAGGGRPLHLVVVSYADGCCQKSLRKNRRQALRVGADEARAYGRADLAPTWREAHRDILSQKKGGGWWLWKPHVILRALKDPAVPWHRGVVVWVDAGNYLHADPRPLVTQALRDSDVSALRLKWCMEADWTSTVTLREMNYSLRYALVDRPQIGAYFLMFRKTELSIAFVEEWLRVSEKRLMLLGAAAVEADGEEPPVEAPGFQKHQADQSVLSLLFKEWGFKAMTLEDGHRVVTLARWRE